jgi:CheY-like chemotaxis protein
VPFLRTPATDAGAVPVEQPARALRLLIAEDEAITAMTIERIAIGRGHRVVDIVENGPEAVAAAWRLLPDLVLMDIRLAHDTDGIAVASELRDSLGIPTIFITAHTDPATRRRADAVRPLGYLVKPFTPDQVAALLDRASGAR